MKHFWKIALAAGVCSLFPLNGHSADIGVKKAHLAEKLVIAHRGGAL